MRKRTITNIVFLVILLTAINKANSQRNVGGAVFESSPLAPTLIDPTWGALPSSQYDINGGANNTTMQGVDDDTNIEGEVSADADDVPPPPDDPQDIPLDGGTSILLLLAAGLEYKRRVKSKN